jgi:hypothetical protein
LIGFYCLLTPHERRWTRNLFLATMLAFFGSGKALKNRK